MAKPNILFPPKWQVNVNGVPLAGGQLFFYNVGTTTKCNTYTDATLGTANPNPIILDANGSPANSGSSIDIYVNQAVKIVCAPSTDTDPPANPIWTELSVTPLGQTVTTASHSGTYTVLTTDRDKFIKADASGGNVTINLLTSASAGDGFTLAVKKIDSSANTVTITPNGSENIDGANSSVVLSAQNAFVDLINDSTQWFKENGTNLLTSVKKQTFTASGTYTPTANMVACVIECVGSGGGGGGTAQSTGQSSGGGGGGGSYSRLYATSATVGASQTVTIGTAGTAGSSGTNNGVAGGDTSVGSICIGKGGSGGIGAAANAIAAGGAGGVAGTGDVKVVGEAGQYGMGGTISTLQLPSGRGGNSGCGFGAGGAAVNATTGTAGSNYGAGGAGGASFNNSAAAAGGAGSQGIVVVTEFISAS